MMMALGGGIQVVCGDVLVVSLKLTPHRQQLLENLWHHLFQGGQIRTVGLAGLDRQLLRCADSGNHIFALRIHQELTVEFVGSRGGVTSEGNACEMTRI